MKYYYLFILIVGIAIYSLRSRSELNKEQGKQIDCLIITSQYEEKGVANKAGSLMVNPPYYNRRLCYETTPMVASNQFVKPVLKFGIPGKEPNYFAGIYESHLTHSV